METEVAERGQPLMWAEWKPASLFFTLIHDLQVAKVVDATPCSGVACLASLYSKVPHSGMAFDETHEAWLRDRLQNLFVAMMYLNRSAQSAKVMLPKIVPTNVFSR